MADPDQIGASMWDYQACTEMVMPMCFDGVNDMFEKSAWNETIFAASCKAIWKVDPRPKMADIMYGSKALFGSSNIIFRYVIFLFLFDSLHKQMSGNFIALLYFPIEMFPEDQGEIVCNTLNTFYEFVLVNADLFHILKN